MWMGFCYQRKGLICLKPPGKGHIQDFLLCCNKTILFWVTEKTGWTHSSVTQDYIWKLIIFAYHSCMIVFLFNGQVFASWKALLISRDLREIVLSPGNADIPTTLHLNSLGMILCVFPKCTKGLSPIFQITDVLDSQSMQEGTQSERSVSPELSPSLLGFQHNLRPN